VACSRPSRTTPGDPIVAPLSDTPSPPGLPLFKCPLSSVFVPDTDLPRQNGDNRCSRGRILERLWTARPRHHNHRTRHRVHTPAPLMRPPDPLQETRRHDHRPGPVHHASRHPPSLRLLGRGLPTRAGHRHPRTRAFGPCGRNSRHRRRGRGLPQPPAAARHPGALRRSTALRLPPDLATSRRPRCREPCSGRSGPHPGAHRLPPTPGTPGRRPADRHGEHRRVRTCRRTLRTCSNPPRWCCRSTGY
jgi:hypothetical protein